MQSNDDELCNYADCKLQEALSLPGELSITFNYELSCAFPEAENHPNSRMLIN